MTKASQNKELLVSGIACSNNSKEMGGTTDLMVWEAPLMSPETQELQPTMVLTLLNLLKMT